MSSIRKYFFISLVGLFLIYPTATHIARDFIKLATFNIAELGDGSHPDTRNELGIPSMLVNLDLDLIAMQEVGSKESGERYQLREGAFHYTALFGAEKDDISTENNCFWNLKP